MRIQYKNNPEAPFDTWLDCSKKKKKALPLGIPKLEYNTLYNL